MISKPTFLQGVYPFEGAGLEKPAPLHPDLTYTVPARHHDAAAVLPRRQQRPTSWSPSC